MPLAKGKSNKAVSKNIQTLVDDYQKSGRIGTSKPASKKAAVKQATAIALQKAGRAKPKKFAEGGSVEEEKLAQQRQQQQRQQQQQQIPFLPLPNQRAPEEDSFPKFKRTVPRMQWTRDPSAYGETTSRSASTRHLLAGNQPRNETERALGRELGMAMKKGGKVSAKKRRA